jgi:uncharacterized membrane protein YhiD involved in acid resistance
MIQRWFKILVAHAIGLLIDLERQRSKGDGSARRSAGLRTFALVALLGAIAMHFGGATALHVVQRAVIALTAFSYF